MTTLKQFGAGALTLLAFALAPAFANAQTTGSATSEQNLLSSQLAQLQSELAQLRGTTAQPPGALVPTAPPGYATPPIIEAGGTSVGSLADWFTTGYVASTPNFTAPAQSSSVSASNVSSTAVAPSAQATPTTQTVQTSTASATQVVVPLTSHTLACIPLTTNLAPGATDATTGGQVSLLQAYLAANPSFYPSGQITGTYGPATEAAVQNVQQFYHIIASGTPGTTGFGAVGPTTRGVFNSCATGVRVFGHPELGGFMTPDTASAGATAAAQPAASGLFANSGFFHPATTTPPASNPNGPQFGPVETPPLVPASSTPVTNVTTTGTEGAGAVGASSLPTNGSALAGIAGSNNYGSQGYVVPGGYGTIGEPIGEPGIGDGEAGGVESGTGSQTTFAYPGDLPENGDGGGSYAGIGGYGSDLGPASDSAAPGGVNTGSQIGPDVGAASPSNTEGITGDSGLGGEPGGDTVGGFTTGTDYGGGGGGSEDGLGADEFELDSAIVPIQNQVAQIASELTSFFGK